MGCDIFWKATEEDIFRQRKCGWFLESLIGRKPVNVSLNSNSTNDENWLWDYRTFNDYYKGYFLNLDYPRKVIKAAALQLIGTSFYFGGGEEIFDHYHNAVAERQFSFVFNNTSYKTPELVTVEVISDFSKPKYEFIRDYFWKHRKKIQMR